MAHIKLVHIATVPVTLWSFFSGQIRFMEERGFHVEAVASPGKFLDEFARREQVPVHPVAMSRRITPLRDLVAVVRLCRVLRTIRPQIVHAHTPKAGLLGMLAAWLTGVPVRVYHLRGLPLLTACGPRRWLLRWAERCACMLAHQVLSVSPSLRRAAIDEGICPAAKIEVLHAGSGNGVDAIGRFSPARVGPSAREKMRTRCKIPVAAMVVGFVGRIVPEKGWNELIAAWRTLAAEFPLAHMLVVGPLEQENRLPVAVEHWLRHDPHVHWVGPQTDTPSFYAAMDVCVLPSHREGFPNVPLEAAAMRLPVVATRIPGCIDAVVDGVTGTLIPVRDVQALTAAIGGYLRSPHLREEHGRNGRIRARRRFGQAALWQALHDKYVHLLAARRSPEPTIGPAARQPSQRRRAA